MKSLKLALFLVLIPLTFISAQSVELVENEPVRPIQHQYNPGKFNAQGELIEKGEISDIVDRACAEAEVALQYIESDEHIPQGQRNFKNTIEALEHVLAQFRWAVYPPCEIRFVSTDPLIIQESYLNDAKAKEFLANIFMRKALYRAFETCQKNIAGTTLDLAEFHSIETLDRQFKQNGTFLEGEAFETVKRLRKRVLEIEGEYERSLNTTTTHLLFTREELAGLPESALEKLEKVQEGVVVRYKVPIPSAVYGMIMRGCTVSETKRRAVEAVVSLAPTSNAELILEAGILRDKIAKLVGYSTWADLRTDGRMVKNAQGVKTFLDAIKLPLGQKLKQKLAALLDIKRESDPGATQVEAWDVLYCSTKLQERLFSFNQNEVSEYLPVEGVVEGILFRVLPTFFGITLRKVEKPDVWEGSELYEAFDRSGKFRGYVAADLFAREGRDRSTQVREIIPGGVGPDGTRVYPVAIIIDNLDRSTLEKPALISFQEYKTLLHEVGHALHVMSIEDPKYTSSSAMSTTWDNIEVPSQVLENLALQREILDRVTGHYKDKTKKLPENLRQALIQAEQFDEDVMESRTLFYSYLDLFLHTTPSTNLEDLIIETQRLYKEINGVELPRVLAEKLLSNQLGHLVNGCYDVGYYTYPYSKGNAMAIVNRLEERDLSLEAGEDYRRAFLSWGAIKHPIEMFRDFFGRDLSPEAYFRKGISEEAPDVTRPDISANLQREMKRLGLRKGEDVARAENAAETKKGAVREWISRHIPRFKFFHRILVLEPS